jgi:hypothetical protein
MKKIIFCLTVFTFITITLHAQNAQTVKNDSIIFNKTVHEYGTIEKGSDGSCVFTFTNKGNKPLILNNVRASCGCTVPEWPRQPVPPGEKGEIKVKYNTNITGNFNKSIRVNSNADNSLVILYVKGNVTQSQ